ncbi:hypothetical protein E4U54_007434 [Claviceps lovelessii]|nr:hypothetical protein E4U54_007434 [Claviceps lovelessii]
MTSNLSDVTILDALSHIQQSQTQLLASVETLAERVNALESIIAPQAPAGVNLPDFAAPCAISTSDVIHENSKDSKTAVVSADHVPVSRSNLTSRIVLTTYPKQTGIEPIAMHWGDPDPRKRGPVVVSRSPSTIRRRNVFESATSSEAMLTNSISGGSYAIYYALAVASKELNSDHRPDYTNTEPAAQIGPFPHWGNSHKIVAMDPWGHLIPWIFRDIVKQEQVDLRPTIAITKAHMRVPELEDSVKCGRLVPDGKVCLNELGELAVTKFAVEPVWYLPGVAERFGIDEGTLRRSLFEHTGGSFPELITRGDMKVFLPPIGGLTVYCFGDPEKMSDENVRLSLRIHDECNGSDVFGSDICTCRPYLIFGIEEAVKEAQNGGSGVVIYFRKEGRALGEVTKQKWSTTLVNVAKIELQTTF